MGLERCAAHDQAPVHPLAGGGQAQTAGRADSRSAGRRKGAGVDTEAALSFADKSAWSDWLTSNAERCPDGVWLRIAKKGGAAQSVSHPDALDVALCHGWMDAQRRHDDEKHWLQRFTPRRARSKWSQINRARALELIANGEMQPRGLAEVDRARADGRWQAAYAPQAQARVPDDLRQALDDNPRADAFFARLDSRNRYSILHRLADAKRPETRARRLATYVTMLAEHRTLHP